MTIYMFMTPKGMRGSSFEAYSDEEAETIAAKPPYCEKVLDMQEWLDEDGTPIILLVVADDE
jgi:hypothetical protein